MNTISLLPAVSAYCEERIRELEVAADQYAAYLRTPTEARIDELRRIVILCEGLEHQQVLLTEILHWRKERGMTTTECEKELIKGNLSKLKQSADPKYAVPPYAKPGEEN